MNYSNLQDFLEKSSIKHTEIAQKDAWAIQQKWREAFSQKVKRKTGNWTYRGFDWHTFSYDLAQYKEGADAYVHYNRVDEQDYIILSEDEDTPSFLCASKIAPDLSALMGDYYIFPETIDWTMVFTHEDGLGPYFARREWQ